MIAVLVATGALVVLVPLFAVEWGLDRGQHTGAGTGALNARTLAPPRAGRTGRHRRT